MTVEVEGAREERTGDGTGQRLLVVDDSDFFRQLLEETLTAAGFEVTTSPDAEEALATLGRELPDLLVVDLVMPGMDGFELVRRVRERWRAGELPLIVVTEILASDVALARLEALGCNGFVNKNTTATATVWQPKAKSSKAKSPSAATHN